MSRPVGANIVLGGSYPQLTLGVIEISSRWDEPHVIENVVWSEYQLFHTDCKQYNAGITRLYVTTHRFSAKNTRIAC